MFSRRVPLEFHPNRLTHALDRLRAAGVRILDLTESNPTRVGFRYAENLLAPLAAPRGLMYEPRPLGDLSARRAVCDDFARRGIRIEPARVALLPGTSD